ncbi:hypothetical protein [Luteitalea pratensis]|nr:hypothetical protein [Luteitalea pratensis]
MLTPDTPAVASPTSTARYVLATLALFTLLTVAATWPQARYATDRVSDPGDPLLNTWALAWVAHQLPFAPAHVFDGNIFHPERRTLAYSETLLAPGVLGAPLLYLGAGPVLVYNLLMLASFVLSGVGTALLVRDLTGSGAAGVVAGAVFAFLPWRFDHYGHFQLLQTQWMPLALWALHRLLREGRIVYGVMLGLMVGGQALTSMYNALFFGVFIAVVGGTLLLADLARARARWRLLLASILVAGALTAPVAIVHSRASELVGERSRAEVAVGSAEWQHFLSSAGHSWLHGRWSAPYGAPERRLYPGVIGVVLALVALWPPFSWARGAYLAGLLVSLELARGLNGWLYGALYDHVFAFRSMRVPARMTIVMGLGLAVLAGFGVERLLRLARSRGVQLAVTSVAVALVMADSWVAPLGLRVVATTPPETYADLLRDKGEVAHDRVIRRLSDPRPSVVLELPIAGADPTYMYYSTFHWQTLVNGYSGFFSDRYMRLIGALNRFPDPETEATVAGLDVRYVVVHGEMMREGEYQRLIAALDARAPDFRLVSRRPWQGSEISLYYFFPR